MKILRQIFFILFIGMVFLSCRKETLNTTPLEIKEWSLAGSAVPGSVKPLMAAQPDGSWSITWPLCKGGLRFSAGPDSVSYGRDERNLLNIAGTDIRVDSSANYTLTVRHVPAGLYSYSIERLRF